MTVNPDKYTVSIVPLDMGVGAVSKVLADGSIKVYLNTMWESDRRAGALKAELDYYKAKVAERAEDKQKVPRCIRYTDGSLAVGPMPVFRNSEIRRIGNGIYSPIGMNKRKIARDIAEFNGALEDVCFYYNVTQTQPYVPIGVLRENISNVSTENVQFIGWVCPKGSGSIPAMAHIEKGKTYGTFYYNVKGRITDAVLMAVIAHDNHHFIITADIRQHNGKLKPFMISRDVDGDFKQVY